MATLTQQPAQPALADADYPALFLVADAASSKAQRAYLRLKAVDLVTLFVASALAVAAGSGFVGGTRLQSPLIFLCAVFIGVGLVMTTLLRQFSFERDWYMGRAVAESVRTRTWRYLMGSEPYRLDAAEGAADTRFLTDLRAFLTQNREISLDLGINRGSDRQITARMREIRALSTAERKALYVQRRVEDQLHWYRRKARQNREAGDRWFLAVIATQIFALVTAIWRVVDTSIPEYTAVFATLAAAFLAWLQLKQHQALSQTYTAAYLDLGFALDAATDVHTEDDLAAYVADTENAVSREHTSWLARTNR